MKPNLFPTEAGDADMTAARPRTQLCPGSGAGDGAQGAGPHPLHEAAYAANERLQSLSSVQTRMAARPATLAARPAHGRFSSWIIRGEHHIPPDSFGR